MIFQQLVSDFHGEDEAIGFFYGRKSPFFIKEKLKLKPGYLIAYNETGKGLTIWFRKSSSGQIRRRDFYRFKSKSSGAVRFKFFELNLKPGAKTRTKILYFDNCKSIIDYFRNKYGPI